MRGSHASAAAGRERMMQPGGQLQVERAEIVIDADRVVRAVGAQDLAQRLVRGLSTGNRIDDYIHPDDHDLVAFCCDRALRDRRPGTLEIRWARDNDRWAKLVTTVAPSGDQL